ncbi:MAG: trans-sulfuration enzyme family protein [Spirochaetia bacterium]
MEMVTAGDKSEELSPEDICAHFGEDPASQLGAVVPPLYTNSLFSRKDAPTPYTYTRINNPTVETAEKKIAALEKAGGALMFASGMGAITAAIFYFLKSGDHAVGPRQMYLPVRMFFEKYLPKFNITFTPVDAENLENIISAVQDNTRLIYLESPVSNLFTLQDLRSTAEFARSRGIKTVIDNTWATPLFQNPLEMGIDMAVHSVSKYLGGHADIIAGCMAASEDDIKVVRGFERGMIGASPDPRTAWMLIRSLRTLPVRMERHQKNGLEVARFLEQHPMVEQVFYPGLPSHPQYELAQKQMSGFTGVMSFIPRAQPKAIRKGSREFTVFQEGPSWGGFESIFNFPGVGISEEDSGKLGIPRGLIRISVGLESLNSIIGSLDRGLNSMT